MKMTDHPELFIIDNLVNKDLFPIKPKMYKEMIRCQVGSDYEVKRLIQYMIDNNIISVRGMTNSAQYIWCEELEGRPWMDRAEKIYDDLKRDGYNTEQVCKIINRLKDKAGIFNIGMTALMHPKYDHIRELLVAENFPVASRQFKQMIMDKRGITLQGATKVVKQLIDDQIISSHGNTRNCCYNIIL